MRVRPHLSKLAYAIALCGVALPAAAASRLDVLEMTHQLTGIWIPATAYGLALIAAVGRERK